jgi:hypothetical protein
MQNSTFNDVNSLDCLQMMAVHHQYGFLGSPEHPGPGNMNYHGVKPMTYPFNGFGGVPHNQIQKNQNLNQLNFIG